MSRFSPAAHLTMWRNSALFTFELVAVTYFLVVAVMSPLAGGSGRWPRVVAAALVVAGAVVGASRGLAPLVRAWLAIFYLVAGYWLPALLVARTSQRFEGWLCRTERSFGSFGPSGFLRSFTWLREVLELAYLCCYPIVPAALLAVDLKGSLADIDRFWTAVLVAGYACYVSLPWLVSRPPRSLHDGDAATSPLRRLNLNVLGHVSHGWNTFPSGHVAVAVAAAVSVAAVSPGAGLLFLIVAAGIAFGSVRGGYHYTVDALAGVIVGITAFAVSHPS